MKKIKLALIILFILFSFDALQASGDELHTGPQVAGESVDEAGHGSQAESGVSDNAEHHTGTPLVYYLNWIGLIVMCVIVLGEIRKSKSEKEHKEDKKDQEFYEAGTENPDDLEHISQKSAIKPMLLIVLAVLVIFSEQLPALFGYIDIEKAKLISGYHENLAAGYFRFVFKVVIGILMLSYGLSSMEEEHH